MVDEPEKVILSASRARPGCVRKVDAAAALRDNLRKRKQQLRERAQGALGTPPAPEPTPRRPG